MLRTFRSFPIPELEATKLKMLSWASPFNIFCFLDNHGYGLPLHGQECLLGAGALHLYRPLAGHALEGLDVFLDAHTDWILGHLGYDLKNEIEPLSSAHPDRTGFPDLSFFVPEVLIRLDALGMHIGTCGGDHERVFHEIMASPVGSGRRGSTSIGTLQQRLDRRAYLSTLAALRAHIQRGDCYEVNFCLEHYSENARIDPLDTYFELARISPSPFSTLYRLGDSHLLCASPERFLRLVGGRIHSQPVKGTSPRYRDDPAKDEASRRHLTESGKERSENVMVVDLVRNDLARVCLEGTVRVDELCGVYSFPQVHQMVSSVSGVPDPGKSFSDILRATFPMGSMTGAPKRRVMELIERYEGFRRGLFSGAVGYISPTGDFDFNVVIRSLFYNGNTGYLSFPTGSGVTFYAEAEQEYAECLLKARAMQEALRRVMR
jgi:para-aminobenzoate synthetase component 1